MEELFDYNTALEMVDNDKDLLKILLDGFLYEAPFDKDKLLELIQKTDYEEGAHYVHRVKGAARQLAAKPLAAKGQELEDMLRGKTERNADKLVSLADEFAELYKQTHSVIEEAEKKL